LNIYVIDLLFRTFNKEDLIHFKYLYENGENPLEIISKRISYIVKRFPTEFKREETILRLLYHELKSDESRDDYFNEIMKRIDELS